MNQWFTGSGGAADFSAVGEDLLPAVDATYDVGSQVLRWQNADLNRLLRIGSRPATGTLTLPVQPTAGDPFTVGDDLYTFLASGANDPGEVNVGANLAAAQTNIVNAINGNDGWNIQNPKASVALVGFVANVAALTARSTLTGAPGMDGNAVVTTSAFTSPLNFFGAATLEGGEDGMRVEIQGGPDTEPAFVFFDEEHGTERVRISSGEIIFTNAVGTPVFEWRESGHTLKIGNDDYDDLVLLTAQIGLDLALFPAGQNAHYLVNEIHLNDIDDLERFLVNTDAADLEVKMVGLPTDDPVVEGQVWNNYGVLMISTG